MKTKEAKSGDSFRPQNCSLETILPGNRFETFADNFVGMVLGAACLALPFLAYTFRQVWL